MKRISDQRQGMGVEADCEEQRSANIQFLSKAPGIFRLVQERGIEGEINASHTRNLSNEERERDADDDHQASRLGERHRCFLF